MGQRRWARLAIGGALSRDALAGALETLTGFQLDACLEEGQVVVEDAEASWGGFSELETWLEARGIPFDLESGACPGGWPDRIGPSGEGAPFMPRGAGRCER